MQPSTYAGGLIPPWVPTAAGWFFHVLCFVLVLYHCLRNRREATAAVLWIFIAWSVPVIGPLLYLSFGVDRLPVKGWRKQVHDERFLAERRAREDSEFPLAYWRAMYESVRAAPPSDLGIQLDRAMDTILPDFPLLAGNAVRPLVDGTEAFPAMLKAIEGAQHHVHIQTFIVGDDEVGRRFMDLLATKARSGVTVRVLYDRFGSTRAMLSGLFRRYRHVPNLRVVGWTQANPLKRQFQINLRNHRKALIVDGSVAFCGGINLHDQTWRGETMRDYHFEVRGPAVLELQYTFMRDWNFMTDEGPDELLRDAYFPRQAPCGEALVRLVNSGPTSEMEAVANVLFLAITSSRRQVLLVTPYFVPGPDVLRALCSAALRGVDVRLIVPRENNHPCAGLAGQALYEQLLESGVRVFLRHSPFAHAKACLVDDAVALVGTANVDIRSLRLNYESNLAVYEDGFANRMKHIVLGDEANSDEIDLALWRRRSVIRRMAENAAALLTPVL